MHKSDALLVLTSDCKVVKDSCLYETQPAANAIVMEQSLIIL